MAHKNIVFSKKNDIYIYHPKKQNETHHQITKNFTATSHTFVPNSTSRVPCFSNLLTTKNLTSKKSMRQIVAKGI